MPKRKTPKPLNPGGCAFEVILADPPWTYRDKLKCGERGAESKYPCLTLADLKALPVAAVAAPNAALLMWIPSPLLPDGIELARAWGFKFKRRAFLWVKRHGGSGKLCFYLGHWTRGNAEECYLFTRGRPKRVAKNVPELYIGPPLKPHSAKPPEIHARTECLFGSARYLELFARSVRPLWTCLGNEIDGQDIRVTLPALREEVTALKETRIRELMADALPEDVQAAVEAMKAARMREINAGDSCPT